MCVYEAQLLNFHFWLSEWLSEEFTGIEKASFDFSFLFMFSMPSVVRYDQILESLLGNAGQWLTREDTLILVLYVASLTTNECKS